MKVLHRAGKAGLAVGNPGEYIVFSSLRTVEKGKKCHVSTTRPAYYGNIESAVEGLARRVADERALTLREWLDEYKEVGKELRGVLHADTEDSRRDEQTPV